MKNLLPFLIVFLLGQTFFSCRSGEHFQFTGTNPEAQHKVKAKPAPGVAVTMLPQVQAPQSEATPVMEANAAASPMRIQHKAAPVAKVPVVTPRLSPLNLENATASSPELAQAREKLASMSKAEKKTFKKELRQAIAQQSDVNLVVLVILALLLPPLAVALYEGITSRFWISLLLTLLFFLPGVIYALLVVTGTI